MPTPLIDADDAAAYLKVHRDTVYALAAAGEIPSYRLSARRLRFRISDLDAWLDQRTREVAR